MYKGELYFLERWALCQALGAMTFLSCAVSLYSMAAVCINRYVYIVRHQYYRKIYTRITTPIMCVSIWICAFLFQLPNLVGWGGHGFDRKIVSCTWDRVANRANALFTVLVCIMMPVIITAITYLSIFLYFRKCSKQVEILQSNNNSSQRKLAKTLFITFFIFVSCWSPYALLVLFDANDEFPDIVYMLAGIMVYTNSSVNFFVYWITNPSFRRVYKRLLGIATNQVESSDLNTTTRSTQ